MHSLKNSCSAGLPGTSNPLREAIAGITNEVPQCPRVSSLSLTPETVEVFLQPARQSILPSLRWSYCLPRVILLSLFWAFLAFGWEPLLHRLLESGLSAASGQSVQIVELKSRFFHTELNVHQASIPAADASQGNVLTLEQASFQVDRNSLLHKKFVVNEMALEGVVWNRDLALSQGKSNKGNSFPQIDFAAQAARLKEQLCSLSNRIAEQLMTTELVQEQLQQFQSVQMATQKKQIWEQRLEDYRIRSRELQTRTNRIREELEQIRQGNAIQQARKVATVSKDLDVVIQEARALKGEFELLPQQLRVDLRDLDDARQADLAMLRERINSIPRNREDLATLLIGPTAVEQIQFLSQWLPYVEQVLDVLTEDYRPERVGGRFVPLDDTSDLPQFLIRQLHVSGEIIHNAERQSFRAELQDLSSDVKKYGKPIRFSFVSAQKGSIEFQGMIDLTEPQPRLSIAYQVQPANSFQAKLFAQSQIGVNMTAGPPRIEGSLEFQGRSINAHCRWVQKDLQFHLDQPLQLVSHETDTPHLVTSLVSQRLQGVLSSIPELQGEFSLTGDWQRPEMKLSSPLSVQLSDQLSQVLHQDLERVEQAAVAVASEELQLCRDEFASEMDDHYRRLVTEIGNHERIAKSLLDKVALKPASGLFDRLIR
ncbi:MAG: hypothetical protein KDA78_07160 [Planctomycetaceae bacterium]|nr:hypothetical protein [Planctomycetaceae bacterium]